MLTLTLTLVLAVVGGVHGPEVGREPLAREQTLTQTIPRAEPYEGLR